MDVREKLVELLFKCGIIGSYSEIERIANWLMNDGVTVQEWILVSERLPEVATTHNTKWDKSTDSIRVLCSCVQADGKKMVKEGYCKVYSDGYVHWKIPGTIHSVTHWQYLPQPPKGE
jgi:hypothetical protein